MTSDLSALCFDAHDPLRLAGLWGAVLAWERADDADIGISLLPSDETGIRFLASRNPKTSSRSSRRRWRERSSSVPGTSTSASARRKAMWCWPTPKATSSA